MAAFCRRLIRVRARKSSSARSTSRPCEWIANDDWATHSWRIVAWKPIATRCGQAIQPTPRQAGRSRLRGMKSGRAGELALFLDRELIEYKRLDKGLFLHGVVST